MDLKTQGDILFVEAEILLRVKLASIYTRTIPQVLHIVYTNTYLL
jgi:hypothetical protein